MTRISSFGLYQCRECGQIHIKPEYGSVSIYVPTDLFYDPTHVLVCKGCFKECQLKDYMYIGVKGKKYTKQPSKVELLIRKLINKPYIELDVRKLYPMFD
jgi:hypothetical protein